MQKNVQQIVHLPLMLLKQFKECQAEYFTLKPFHLWDTPALGSSASEHSQINLVNLEMAVTLLSALYIVPK